MNDFWDKYGNEMYTTMENRHLPLRKFVAKFITDFDIKSMVEVGGGYGKWKELVEDYTCIELNKRAYEKMKFIANYIHGDFCEIDLEQVPKNSDLFMALAVVEHCKGYKEFLKLAIELNPRYIIINFFFGLTELKVDKYKIKSKNGKKYYTNKYSRKVLYKVLEDLGVLDRSTIIRMNTLTSNKKGEDVLIVNLRKEVESSFKINKIMEEIK